MLRVGAVQGITVATMLTVTPIRVRRPATNSALEELRRGLDQPPDALVDDQQPEHEQRRAVELRGQDLGALEPYVIAPLAGRAASRSATSARPRATASVSMRAASLSSASEEARMPKTIFICHQAEEQREALFRQLFRRRARRDGVRANGSLPWS